MFALSNFTLLTAQITVGVAVAPDDPQSSEFASYLSDEADLPVVVHTSTTGFERAKSGVFPAWEEPILVFFDPPTRRVLVARRDDGTALLRALGPATERGSTYAAVIVAAELIRLAHTAASATSEATPREPSLAANVYVSLGVGALASFGHEPTLLEPRLIVGAELGRKRGRIFSRLGVGLRVPVETTSGEITYRRWGPSVVVAAGWRTDRIRFGGRVEAGMALTRARARSPQGTIEGEVSRTPLWATVGPFFELKLGAGISLTADTTIGWSASPADYRVRGETLLAEGRFRWGGTAGVAWRWQAP